MLGERREALLVVLLQRLEGLVHFGTPLNLLLGRSWKRVLLVESGEALGATKLVEILLDLGTVNLVGGSRVSCLIDCKPVSSCSYIVSRSFYNDTRSNR